MKVLMTADTVGGVWNYALELARAFGRLGIEVELATMGAPPTAPQIAQAEQVPTLTMHVSRFALEWMDDPWGDVAAAGEWLLDLERRLRPDVVQINGYAHGALEWSAPVVVVGHSCVLSWWEAVHGEAAPDYWNRYREAVAAGLHAADLVIAPTKALLGTLSRFYGAPSHARVIPNGRDAARYVPGEKEPIVLAAGRLWDEAKNVRAVCDAAAAVTWPVFVAGDTRAPSGAECGITGATPLGRLSERELAGWMARAAIYAFPARYEPFGLSVLEAALARCALVLGDIPSLRENWDSAAIFVDPADPEQLVWALDRLADAPALREALAAEAHARARKLTPGRMAASYLEAFAEVGVPIPELSRQREVLCAS